jgi:hypothetical protein
VQEEGEALFGLATVRHMGGLKVVREVELDAAAVDSDAAADVATPVADLAVSGGVHSKRRRPGLGWSTVLVADLAVSGGGHSKLVGAYFPSRGCPDSSMMGACENILD